MAWYPDTPEEWGTVITVLGALGIAWKRYRSERRNGKGETVMASETCPVHAAVKERLEWGNERFSLLEQSMSEVKQGIAVIGERVASIKEMVIGNREAVTDQYLQLAALIRDLAKKP
jgi:hypothetical protein